MGIGAVRLRRIGVMTSGGDAPGMNAAVRATYRMARHLGLEVVGIRDGYEGLLHGQISTLQPEQVDGIERLGGTVLGTSRSAAFRTPQGIERGLRQLDRQNIEGLVVVGGMGSFEGANALHARGFPVVGVPASIDDEVGGTDVAIGVDTAVNTALDAIDKLKDTASAFHRAFVVEVMGRHSGRIALESAIGGGAEMVLIPEVPFQIEDVVRRIKEVQASGKTHFLLVAAEGTSPPAAHISDEIQRRDDVEFESRLTVLGHIQRGGSPMIFDRYLASRLGAKAAEELACGRAGSVIGLRATSVVPTPIDEAIQQSASFSPETYRFAEILAG
jgi:6-phosphofructokinase 1